MFNCLVEALLQNIEEDCQCLEGDFQSLFPSMRVCSGQDRPCVKAKKRQFGVYHSIKSYGVNVPCLASCSGQSFESSSSQSNFPSMNSFLKSTESCFLMKKIERLCHDDRKDIIDNVYPRICELTFPSGLDCMNQTKWRKVKRFRV